MNAPDEALGHVSSDSLEFGSSEPVDNVRQDTSSDQTRPFASVLNLINRPFACILYLTSVVGVAIAGFWLWIPNSTKSDLASVFSFALGSRAELDPQGLPPLPETISRLSKNALIEAITQTIEYDKKVTIGVFLVLIASAGLVAVLISFSRPHSRLRDFFIAAVFVATFAHLLVNALISWSLDPPEFWPLSRLSGRFWIDLATAMSAFEFAALAVGFVGFGAALVLLVRWALSHGQAFHYRIFNDGRNWWDAALPRDDMDPKRGDMTTAEAAWEQAYFVPDASEISAKYRTSSSGPTALCLSGGGIRSACVSMGAMQAFAAPALPGGDRVAPELDSFDWVISVSGGGFSAGARVLGVQGEMTKSGEPRGAISQLRDRFTPGSVEFAFLRRKSSYIAGSPLGLLRAFAELFKNFLVSAVAVYWSAVLLGLVLGFFVVKGPGVTAIPREGSAVSAHPIVAIAAIGIPMAIAVLCISAAQVLRLASASRLFTAGHRSLMLVGAGAALFSVPVFILTVAVPGLVWICQQLPSKGLLSGLLAIPVVIAAQYGGTLFLLATEKTRLNPVGWLNSKSPGAVRLLLFLFPFSVLCAAWLLVLGIVAERVVGYFDSIDTSGDVNANQPLIMEAIRLLKVAITDPNGLVLALFLVTLALCVVDATSLSLHQFYRRRLARAFAVRRRGVRAVKYPANEKMWLDTHGKALAGGPKFVFAAAAAISDGDNAAPHGLNSVSFVMTADFIGGPALGWLRSSELRKATPPRLRRDLTVDTAVAVSGSAFASAMGRHGSGVQTMLAALSGARLGTWLPNPRFVENAKKHATNPWFLKGLPFVRGLTYLYREVLSLRESEAPLVQVTDGGHYENLGLVEALRRRCRLIYCIDSGLDDPPLLSGLADAARLAKFELGVEIIPEQGGPYGVESLSPGTGEPFSEAHAFCDLNGRVTKNAVMRARIEYPPASGLEEGSRTGWLIFAKAVLWRELPHWVMTHAGEGDGAEFPHDTTSDQWFTERRFAAYTELGRCIATSAIHVRVDGVSANSGALPDQGGRLDTHSR